MDNVARLVERLYAMAAIGAIVSEVYFLYLLWRLSHYCNCLP